MQNFRVGHETPSTLFLFSQKLKNEGLSKRDLPGHVIRKALEKNWPIPEGLEIDIDGISIREEIEEKAILVTRFEPIDAVGNQALLKVLSQKSNGEVYLEGKLKITFL
jgi:hypothetical protein